MIIATGHLTGTSLQGQTAVITGAGGGIGYEAARALIWLGAKVVLAEINPTSGQQAEIRLAQEFGTGKAKFIQTDVGGEQSVENLKMEAVRAFGKVDIVINNATIAPLGAVMDAPIGAWDESYRVNLRGPVLLARTFLPDMVKRGEGVFMGVSSFGQAYMAPYEALKAAQAHLGSSLAEELASTGVQAFTIGPGFVPTQTALESIPRLAKFMNLPADDLFAIVKDHEISVEEAGAGFAAAAALAERYTGKEISSVQALLDAGIPLAGAEPAKPETSFSQGQFEQALDLCKRVRTTLAEQSAGWKKRSLFERQWMIRTFRSKAGMPVEQWLDALQRLENDLEAKDVTAVREFKAPLSSLAAYYANLYEMAEGYLKDPQQRAEQLEIVKNWQGDVEQLEQMLG